MCGCPSTNIVGTMTVKSTSTMSLWVYSLLFVPRSSSPDHHYLTQRAMSQESKDENGLHKHIPTHADVFNGFANSKKLSCLYTLCFDYVSLKGHRDTRNKHDEGACSRSLPLSGVLV